MAVSYTHLDVYKRQAEQQELVLHHVGDEPSENSEIDQVEEQTGGDERQRPPMGAAHLGVVHRFVDEAFDRLCHFQRPRSRR